MAERKSYPLSWPDGWKRTGANLRKSAAFNRKEREYGAPNAQGQRSQWTRTKDLSIFDAVKRLLAELERMGVKDWNVIISTNVPLRLDGLPRSDKEPSDPGAAVYWKRRDQDATMRCMAIDRYTRVADNLAAIAATLEFMRGIERHGGAQIMDRAFLGFAALPEKASSPWREVLGLDGQTPDLEDVENRFRALVHVHHPDKGGDREKFEEIVRAREAAQIELSM
jgi:hypothetical protein